MANPLVRPHMNFLPHADGNRLSQAWNGHKMVHDMPDHILTPCARVGGKMFYVNELVRRKHDWFIPLRWITSGENRELYAVGHIVKETPVCSCHIVVQSSINDLRCGIIDNIGWIERFTYRTKNRKSSDISRVVLRFAGSQSGSPLQRYVN